MVGYDFAGWATKNNLVCSDRRVIMENAFVEQDGKKVPLVWNHEHKTPDRVLGHAILENRKEGVYAYCYFNDSPFAQYAKTAVEHGDVDALSIYANNLKQNGSQVLHGSIKEVSLVLAGANPGAFIESIIRHSEEAEDEFILFSGEALELQHSEEKEIASEETIETKIEETEEPIKEEKIEHSNKEDKVVEEKEKTVQEVVDSMSEEQKTVLYALVAAAADGTEMAQSEINEEDNTMKHNVFYGANNEELKHSDVDVIGIFKDAKGSNSLKDVVLAHSITDIDFLFPEARTLTDVPQMITREMTWVPEVLGSVHKSPFSRIKSLFANLTEAEARAKGYMKGNLKTEQVFTLLKRTTTPQTIYKKQKLDRDDVIDIVDFDVVAWIKVEMRFMLDEEIARAILVGDGRLADSDDKINEQNIRPVWTDADLYTIKSLLEFTAAMDSDTRAKMFIRACVKSRKDYKGSGNPVMFTTEDFLTDCLLLEDEIGRRIYTNVTELATALRVSKIVTVPVMEGLTREVNAVTHNLMGLIVNLADYNLGADKGGAVSLFDDFDIDFNQMKYLIETRCSGALVRPYSAIAIEYKTVVA